jgi:hypothetical protein
MQRRDDPTKTAMLRQLKAMGLETFEVSLIYEGEKEKVHNRNFTATPKDLVEKLPRLKLDNKRGANVYIRGPRNVDHGLILLDDIDGRTPEKMAAVGIKPAVVVETSPDNFQAWVKLSKAQPAELRLEIARVLQQRFGGDPGGVGAHQAGRIAGFSNQKRKHKQANGLHPFGKLISGWGKPIEPAAEQEILREAELALEKKREERSERASPHKEVSRQDNPQEDSRVRPEAAPTSKGDVDPAIKEVWLEAYRAREKQNPHHPNLSEVDWKMCCKALELGATPEIIRATLEDVATRKGTWAASYASITVGKAVAAQERKAGIGESSSRLGRDHDRPRPTEDALQR